MSHARSAYVATEMGIEKSRTWGQLREKLAALDEETLAALLAAQHWTYGTFSVAPMNPDEPMSYCLVGHLILHESSRGRSICAGFFRYEGFASQFDGLCRAYGVGTTVATIKAFIRSLK